MRLLRLNTMPAFDPKVLSDVSKLSAQSSTQLRNMGRLPYPMRRDRNDKGFQPISWDEALDCIASRTRDMTPDRTYYY